MRRFRLQLLAVWYVTQWQAQGMPKRARIIELGPGRGTLMDDMLRVSDSPIHSEACVYEMIPDLPQPTRLRRYNNGCTSS